MKRVAFAWITEWVDFNDRDEAIKYVGDGFYKGWRFLTADGMYSRDAEEVVYENSNDEYKWTVRVEMPYRHYNMG